MSVSYDIKYTDKIDAEETHWSTLTIVHLII